MGCFISTGTFEGHPQNFMTQNSGLRDRGRKENWDSLSPTLGTKMWLVLFSLLHVGFRNMLNRITT